MTKSFDDSGDTFDTINNIGWVLKDYVGQDFWDLHIVINRFNQYTELIIKLYRQVMHSGNFIKRLIT